MNCPAVTKTNRKITASLQHKNAVDFFGFLAVRLQKKASLTKIHGHVLSFLYIYGKFIKN